MKQSNLACTNPKCEAYNKYVLPSEAKFCPKCGSKIIQKEKTHSDISIVDALFPVWGIKLGETKVDTVEEYRSRIIELNDGQLFKSVSASKDEFIDEKVRYAISDRINSNDCLNIAAFYSGADRIFNSLYVYESSFVDYFAKWREFGFDPHLAYNGWIGLFRRKGFIIWQTYAPQYINNLWQAEIVAIANDNTVKLRLEFESHASDLSCGDVLKRLKIYSPLFENYALVENNAEINGAGGRPGLLYK